MFERCRFSQMPPFSLYKPRSIEPPELRPGSREFYYIEIRVDVPGGPWGKNFYKKIGELSTIGFFRLPWRIDPKGNKYYQ